MKLVKTMKAKIGVVLSTLLLSQFAMAQAASDGLAILTDGHFQTLITFGLGIFAAWKWFLYIANWSPGGAFTEIITPALLTALAFKWKALLSMTGISQAT